MCRNLTPAASCVSRFRHNYSPMDKSVVYAQHLKTRFNGKPLLAAVILSCLSLSALNTFFSDWQDAKRFDNVPIDAAQILEKCNALKSLPGPPSNFHQRSHSDRFVHGTPPTLFKNATIWTGRVSGNEILTGDLLIDKGLIKGIGYIKDKTLADYKDLVVINAEGAWLTPGYVTQS